MDDIALRAVGLGKRYKVRGGDEFWALRDASFDIRRGEVVGLVGNNGAGKSTLLKVLGRITDPTEGRAEINGRVGMLLEVGTGFHPDLTGRENVFLGGAILGMTRREIQAKYDAIVDFAETDDFMDVQVRRFSSGMNLRLALSVAVHLAADIIFLDEIWAVGDAAFQRKSLDRIEAMIADGRTFIVVSHARETIERLCSRCLLMERGRLVMDDAPDVILSRISLGTARRAGSEGRFAEHTACRSCGGDLTGPRLDFGDLPICNDYAVSPGSSRHPLSMTECPTCGQIQLVACPPPAMVTPRVSWIRYNEPDAHLDAVAGELARVLGVTEGLAAVGFGPFDGPLLERLARLGMRTEAVDVLEGRPRPRLRHPYLETIQEAIDDATTRPTAERGGASIVALRYILEHCHQPLKTLEALAGATAPDGLLVVEVPDSSKFLTRGDYSFVWEEHTLYFTEATLRGLLERAGLEVISVLRYEGALEDALVAVCRRSRGDASRTAVAVPSAPSPFAEFAATRDARALLWRARLDELAPGGKVAVFGAGHQAVMFVNALGLADRVATLVDDDPNKVGRVPAGMTAPIISSEAMIADPDIKLCLLAVAPRIHDRIRGKYRSFLDRGGVMMSIFPTGAGDTPIETPPEGIERVNAEVFRAPGPVGAVNRAHLAYLNIAARTAPRGRVRVNLHGDGSDPLHQMIITMSSKSYIRPHKHPGKIESFHIVDGELDVVVFDEVGEIAQVVRLSSDPTRGAFCYRMSEPLYHTLIIRSETLTIHEITNGPFVPGGSIFASFSPEEGDVEAASVFIANLRERVAGFRKDER